MEAYRLEAERQRLEAEKWRLEYERLALELAQCRTSLPDPERQANSSDLQEKALALALAACDLAWADALDSSDEFSCAEVSLIHVLEANNSQEGDAGLENLHDVAVTIMSAGDEDGTDGCEVSAVHTNSTVPATTLWTPRAR
ncbi:MAG: hypothetical protein D6E12_08435 [Desulfovibrio sp.]|nr:MAG: hypothetical protein D6E12_08435 [Desulfovibrio sp.]